MSIANIIRGWGEGHKVEISHLPFPLGDGLFFVDLHLPAPYRILHIEAIDDTKLVYSAFSLDLRAGITFRLKLVLLPYAY